MTDNVIRFPKDKRGTPPQSIEEIIEKTNDNRENYMTELSYTLALNVMAELQDQGFDPTQSFDNANDIILLVEAIKSLAYKTIGHHYPIQDIVKNFVDVEDKEAFMSELFGVKD